MVSEGPRASISKYEMFLMIIEVLQTYFYIVKLARSGRIRVCIEKKWVYKVSDVIKNVSWVFSNFFPPLETQISARSVTKVCIV